jgi:hypothetical protein
MIKHIVMWNVRGDSVQEKRKAALLIKVRFEALVGKIPGLKHLEVGVDMSQVGYACDVVLYSEFDNKESLDAYGTHPEHTRVRKELGDIRIARYQVDYLPI